VAHFVRKLAYLFNNYTSESSFTTHYVWKLSPCWNWITGIHLHRQQLFCTNICGFLASSLFPFITWIFLYL